MPKRIVYEKESWSLTWICRRFGLWSACSINGSLRRDWITWLQKHAVKQCSPLLAESKRNNQEKNELAMDKTLSPFETVCRSQDLTFFNQAHIWMFTPTLHNALKRELINKLNHLEINLELGATSSMHEFLERDLIFLTDYVSRSHQRKIGRKGNEGIIQILLKCSHTTHHN